MQHYQKSWAFKPSSHVFVVPFCIFQWTHVIHNVQTTWTRHDILTRKCRLCNAFTRSSSSWLLAAKPSSLISTINCVCVYSHILYYDIMTWHGGEWWCSVVVGVVERIQDKLLVLLILLLIPRIKLKLQAKRRPLTMNYKTAHVVVSCVVKVSINFWWKWWYHGIMPLGNNVNYSTWGKSLLSICMKGHYTKIHHSFSESVWHAMCLALLLKKSNCLTPSRRWSSNRQDKKTTHIDTRGVTAILLWCHVNMIAMKNENNVRTCNIHVHEPLYFICWIPFS